MREIKFRGKRVDNGEWVYGDLLTKVNELSKQPAIVCFNGSIIPKSIKVIPETVGQFTGLCDKNGKEVYEGDVVKLGSIYYLCIIIFDKPECGYAARSTKTGQCYGIGTDVKNRLEVIGNIHENPSLLEVN